MKANIKLELTLDPHVIPLLLRNCSWQEASGELEAAVRDAERLIERHLYSLIGRASELGNSGQCVGDDLPL